jgi:hypothetical protein
MINFRLNRLESQVVQNVSVPGFKGSGFRGSKVQDLPI